MRTLGFAAAAAVLAGCSSMTGKTYPSNATIIPDVHLAISPTNIIPLENFVYGAAGAALLYYIFDPLAPNWEIAETRLAEDSYRLSMKLKRFHRGGDGEAMMAFRRRAMDLRLQNGYGGYEIVDYVEGVESPTIGAQRFSEGVIKLVKAPATATPPR